jgi:hypothetical protein
MCRILLQALAQDQLRALLELTGGAQTAQKFGIGVYDGDTNQELRPRLRESARVVPAKVLIDLFIYLVFLLLLFSGLHLKEQTFFVVFSPNIAGSMFTVVGLMFCCFSQFKASLSLSCNKLCSE